MSTNQAVQPCVAVRSLGLAVLSKCFRVPRMVAHLLPQEHFLMSTNQAVQPCVAVRSLDLAVPLKYFRVPRMVNLSSRPAGCNLNREYQVIVTCGKVISASYCLFLAAVLSGSNRYFWRLIIGISAISNLRPNEANEEAFSLATCCGRSMRCAEAVQRTLVVRFVVVISCDVFRRVLFALCVLVG